MARFFTGSSTRQIATVVVLSLMLAHGLSAAVWLLFGLRGGPPPEYIKPASQIGLVLRLLEVLPAADHPAVLAALNDAGVSAQQGAGSPPTLTSEEDPQQHGFQHALQQEAGLTSEVLSLGRQIAADGDLRDLEVVIKPHGSEAEWLLFKIGPPSDQHGIPFHGMSPNGLASFVAIPLLVMLASLWAARKISSPLIRLAAATDRLVILQGLDAVAVPEEGALEVRQVARAFNVVLERLQRFVMERTEMLAAISHDLRTPLTRLELRAETIGDITTRRKILNDVRMMETMIGSTLAFIRDEAAQEADERVDLAVLVQTICDDFNDAGAEVQYEGPVHGVALCRPQAFRRAISNLIDNAVALEATVIVRLEMGDGFTVTIEDSGPGIPDEQKKVVFEPFYRGDSSRNVRPGGMGLGLSIVRAIVRSHKGEIILTDRHPQGLRVQIRVPAKVGSSSTVAVDTAG